VVRDSPKGPGLVVRGWLEARALHLYAARDLAIVAPHVVIPRDEAIAIVGAAGTLARVAPRYGEFTSLVHDTPCDASSLALSATATRTPLSGKTWVHLAARTASLFSGAEGGPILSLDASREGPSFLAIEERAGRVHVRYHDGVAIDGWIRAAELLPGEGPDCDDCHGWPLEMADSCPCLEPSEDADGCPEVPSAPSRAVMTAPVRTRPDETSAALGELESGASVCARETRGAYTHVVAGGGIASTGGGFWVPSASLAAQ